MPRVVTIPPFLSPDGITPAPVRVRAELVDLYGRATFGNLILATTDEGLPVLGAMIGGASIITGAAPIGMPLTPNAEISPATRWRIRIEHQEVALAPVDCTLLAGSGALPLAELLQIGAPADPLDFWAAYLPTAAQRAALGAAHNPSATNPIATLADLVSGAGHTIRNAAGDDLPARAALRFIGAAVTDDDVDGESRVTIAASAVQSLTAGAGILITSLGSGAWRIERDPNYTINGGTP